MKIRFLWLLYITILSIVLITGCSKREEIPKGFSEKSYNDFTKIYKHYEEAKKAKNKQVKGLDILFEYRKKDDQGKLSPQESKVRDALSNLLLIYNSTIMKVQNTFPAEAEDIVDNVSEDENKIPVLEKTIIETLKLKGTNKSNGKTNDINKKSNSTKIKIDENCPKPYTKEDCEKFEEYYKNGDGQQEP